MKKQIIGMLLCAILGFFTPAQAKEQLFKDWALRCDNTLCRLEQRVFIKENTESPLVHISFQTLEAQINGKPLKNLWIMVRVPLNVQLQPGLALSVKEDRPVHVPFTHCNTNGCVSLMPLSKDLRADLESGTRAVVTYQLINGRKIGVPVSLHGITAGLKALDP